MTALIAGLAIFLGIHSLRIYGENFRTRQIQRLGPQAWKGIYSVLSLAGFALLVWGYGQARANPVVLWTPPAELRSLTLVLTVGTEILIAAAYLPRNRFKSTLGHPMLAGAMLWSVAHLLSNGTAHSVLVFVAFLVWALAAYRAARQRDRTTGVSYEPGPLWRTLLAMAMGAGSWSLIAFVLHGWLIGTRPFG